jgi:hypothetical protein
MRRSRGSCADTRASVRETLAKICALVSDAALLIAPDCLAAAEPVAGPVFCRQGRTKGFWHWLVRAETCQHRSNPIDVQLFLNSRLVTAFRIRSTGFCDQSDPPPRDGSSQTGSFLRRRPSSQRKHHAACHSPPAASRRPAPEARWPRRCRCPGWTPKGRRERQLRQPFRSSPTAGSLQPRPASLRLSVLPPLSGSVPSRKCRRSCTGRDQTPSLISQARLDPADISARQRGAGGL